jgi:EAL domain-containing protein (putative c-di-GMP-specific phosphodiesterase class I)/GGDEF domain-containing protein
MRSFRNRLLILLIGLVVGAQTVTLFTALPRTRIIVRENADAQLVKGARFATDQFGVREQQLANGVSLMALDYGLKLALADYGLKQSLGQVERDTVASVLANHAKRVGASLALALDPHGKLIASGEGMAVDPELMAVIATDQTADAGALLAVTSHGVHQVFTSPVDDIGRIAMSYTVDAELARELSRRVGAEVAFLADANGERRFVASTLAGQPQDGKALRASLRDTTAITDIGGQQYLATVTHLTTEGPSLDLAVLNSMDNVMAPYRNLRQGLLLAIGATLAAAIIAGIYLGRSAARPVQQLAAGAARIAAGDYSQAVVGSGGRELEHLAQAFNSMQAGIADRESRLLQMATHDAATGLPNRVYAEEWLNGRLQELGRSERVGVVLIAVTNLQEISASLGNEVTEQLVWHLARSLEGWSGQNGLVARIDATHFAVATSPVTESGMSAFVALVCERSQTPLATAGITLQAATVLGAVVTSRHGGNAAELLRCAEAAVETAIQQRQPFAFFERASDELQRRRLKLGSDLVNALQSGQLHLLYQPKFRMQDRRAKGVEALARWQHPDFGMVSPAEFVPIAERTGASGALTRWVLRTALVQLAAWQKQGLRIEVAINLSAADIVDPDILQFILEALRDTQLAPGLLTLEITESVLIHEPQVARRNMALLRVAGVRFSIDDFGTGYSSLSQLRELAVDELKIDRSFVVGLTEGAEHGAVIRAITDLGHGLGMRIVAEGVEHEAQWRLLAGMGCDFAQGYLTGRPQTSEELTPLLLASNPGVTDSAATASLRLLEMRRRERSTD